MMETSGEFQLQGDGVELCGNQTHLAVPMGKNCSQPNHYDDQAATEFEICNARLPELEKSNKNFATHDVVALTVVVGAVA
jgi:hypothetical protein